MPMTEAQGAPIPELCSAPWWWSSGCLQPMEGIEGILETGDLSRFRKKLGPLETWMVWQNSQLWPIPRCKLQKPRQTENRWDRGGRMVWQLFCRFVGHLILSSCIVLKVRVQYSWRMLVCAHGCIYVFYHILSYFIIPYHILSYLIIFYHILSYFIIFHQCSSLLMSPRTRPIGHAACVAWPWRWWQRPGYGIPRWLLITNCFKHAKGR